MSGFSPAFSAAFFIAPATPVTLAAAGSGQASSFAGMVHQVPLQGIALGNASASAAFASGDTGAMETTHGFYTPAVGRRWLAKPGMAGTTWPTKHPVERVTAEFDFAGDLAPGDALLTYQLVVTTVRGTDATPGAVLYGTPQIKGARVFQKFAAGVSGCSYRIECRVTTRRDDLLILSRVLPVESF